MSVKSDKLAAALQLITDKQGLFTYLHTAKPYATSG